MFRTFGYRADGRRPRTAGGTRRPSWVLPEPAGVALPPRPAVSDHRTVPPAEPGAGLPPGTTTLRSWAARHGRTHDYLRRWRRRDGFPSPVGELPARGRHGGGRGELLFDEKALDTWLAGQADLEAPERFDLVALGLAADDRITLGRFAALAGRARNTVIQHLERPGFPQAGADGTYRVGDLSDYWNSRTGHRGQAREPRAASLVVRACTWASAAALSFHS
jgi:hypothetical protein